MLIPNKNGIKTWLDRTPGCKFLDSSEGLCETRLDPVCCPADRTSCSFSQCDLQQSLLFSAILWFPSCCLHTFLILCSCLVCVLHKSRVALLQVPMTHWGLRGLQTDRLGNHMQRMPLGGEQSQPKSPRASHSLRARQPAISLASCLKNTRTHTQGPFNQRTRAPQMWREVSNHPHHCWPPLLDRPRFQQQDMRHTHSAARRLLKASV